MGARGGVGAEEVAKAVGRVLSVEEEGVVFGNWRHFRKVRMTWRPGWWTLGNTYRTIISIICSNDGEYPVEGNIEAYLEAYRCI